MPVDIIIAISSAIGHKVRTQFGYLFFYKLNIKNLEKEVKQLEIYRNDVDDSFIPAQRAWPSTDQWLEYCEEVTEEAAYFLRQSKYKSKAWCLNLKNRYVLSKKFVKLAAEIRELHHQVPKRVATNLALPVWMLPESLSNDTSIDLKSRTEFMDKVMEALKDDKINIIGICSFGGIGKTTILHKVLEMATTQNLFDKVAMTTVSQDSNLNEIQSDIADKLGLTIIKDVDDIVSGADSLYKRLNCGSRILVVLDDVCSVIKLEEVGIPVRNGRATCKVLLASRNESVCNYMGAQKTILVEVLCEEEAWNLFQKTAGDCVEREKLEDIAKKIVNECRGVPIVLVTVAKELSNKKRRTWEDTYIQLRRSGMSTNILEMEKYVSSSIMSSCCKLPQAQLLLLICCQHPADAEIKVEKLARYCLALKLFKNVDKVVDARAKTYEVINHLMSCSLLQVVDVDEKEKDWEDKTVEMPNYVTDLCLSIAPMKEERGKVYMHYMAQNTDGGYELGTSHVNYSKLKLLMQAPLNGGLLDKSFIQKMEELRVFESHKGDEDHPPPALDVLVNLRMLSLERNSLCEKITSTIGRLSKLEILSFWRSKISSFPREIGQLSNLRLLDLRCIGGEGLIPSDILPRLNKLEELYMGNFILLGAATDNHIQSGRNGESHGRITELDSLTSITTLQINLLDLRDLLDLKSFPFKNLKSFFLASSKDTDDFSERNRLCKLVQKTIKLGNLVGMRWVNWVLRPNIKFIVMSTVDLQLEDIKDWTHPLILEEFVSLKKLDLRRCKQLEYIPGKSLGKLQVLKLTDMPAMKYLWVGPAKVILREIVIRESPGIEIREEPPNDFMGFFRDWFLRNSPHLQGFSNLQLADRRVQQPLLNPLVMLPSLKTVDCSDVHQLKQIVGGRMLKLPKLVASDWLQNLEVITVSRCDSLETVFDFEGLHNMGENAPTLGELKYVKLRKLPYLEHLCRQIPKGIHVFKNLGALDVEGCGSLGYLISSSTARMLVNLRSLSVRGCNSMKEAIEMNKDYDGCNSMKEEIELKEDYDVKIIEFHSLSRVILQDLEKLSSFCSSYQQAFKFPSLREVLIVNCPQMKTFCCGDLTTEKLHGVKVSPPRYNDDELVWKDDLNGTVQYLNARPWDNQKNRDLEKDDVSEEGIAEYVECTNETESSRRSSSNFVESIGDDEVESLKIKGKEKVAKNEEVDGNDKFLSTEVVLHKFLDAMVEEVHKGNRTTTTFSREGWNFIINALKHYNITKTQCINKFDELRNEYNCFKNLCKETGIVVKPETGMIYAEDQVWEKLKKVIKGCDMFRKSGCPYFSKLQIIFEDTTSTSKNARPSTTRTSDSENDDDNEDLQDKRRNSFAYNLQLFMQQINETNAKKWTEILEKQFGQASQSSESTIRDSGGNTYVKPNEDLAQFSECVVALNELNDIDGPSFAKAMKVLREDPFMRVAFLKLPSDKRKKFVKQVNEDLAQFSECVDALNELNDIDGLSYTKAMKVLREDPFMRVAFLKLPTDKRKDFVLNQ